jgi:hypothetical protein
VPAGIVELKQDVLVVAHAHRSGKIGEDEFEQLLAAGVAMFHTVRPSRATRWSNTATAIIAMPAMA